MAEGLFAWRKRRKRKNWPRSTVLKALTHIAKGGYLRKKQGQGGNRTSAPAQNAQEAERILRKEPETQDLSFRDLSKKAGIRTTALFSIAKDYLESKRFKKAKGKRMAGQTRLRRPSRSESPLAATKRNKKPLANKWRSDKKYSGGTRPKKTAVTAGPMPLVGYARNRSLQMDSHGLLFFFSRAHRVLAQHSPSVNSVKFLRSAPLPSCASWTPFWKIGTSRFPSDGRFCGSEMRQALHVVCRVSLSCRIAEQRYSFMGEYRASRPNKQVVSAA